MPRSTHWRCLHLTSGSTLATRTRELDGGCRSRSGFSGSPSAEHTLPQLCMCLSCLSQLFNSSCFTAARPAWTMRIQRRLTENMYGTHSFVCTLFGGGLAVAHFFARAMQRLKFVIVRGSFQDANDKEKNPNVDRYRVFTRLHSNRDRGASS